MIDPEDEEQVFALLETKLNQMAKARGELCMTVPMLWEDLFPSHELLSPMDVLKQSARGSC